MNDWELLLAASGRRASTGVEVGEPHAWDRGGVDGLPELSRLLAAATVTPVSANGMATEVLAWGEGGRRRGWWCPAPGGEVAGAHPIHRELSRRFGGIMEVFGEVESRWSPDHPETLTVAAAETDLAGDLDAYRWIWEDDGLTMPIAPGDYYVVSREANGNLTIVERDSGRLLLFAPDHAFSDVTVLDGCPEYSLYTVDGVPGLVDWIEAEARVWAAG